MKALPLTRRLAFSLLQFTFLISDKGILVSARCRSFLSRRLPPRRRIYFTSLIAPGHPSLLLTLRVWGWRLGTAPCRLLLFPRPQFIHRLNIISRQHLARIILFHSFRFSYFGRLYDSGTWGPSAILYLLIRWRNYRILPRLLRRRLLAHFQNHLFAVFWIYLLLTNQRFPTLNQFLAKIIFFIPCFSYLENGARPCHRPSLVHPLTVNGSLVDLRQRFIYIL